MRNIISIHFVDMNVYIKHILSSIKTRLTPVEVETIIQRFQFFGDSFFNCGHDLKIQETGIEQ